MPTVSETIDSAGRKLDEALQLIPDTRPVNLPPTDLIPDVAAWHGFEHDLWKIGEEIRLLLNTKTKARTDEGLYSRMYQIASDRRGMRGRQSFVLLFAYKPCIAWAGKIAALLPDTDIDGQVISAVYKMRASGLSEAVLPYHTSGIAWIRKEAKRYLDFDQSPNKALHANPDSAVASSGSVS